MKKLFVIGLVLAILCSMVGCTTKYSNEKTVSNEELVDLFITHKYDDDDYGEIVSLEYDEEEDWIRFITRKGDTVTHVAGFDVSYYTYLLVE